MRHFVNASAQSKDDGYGDKSHLAPEKTHEGFVLLPEELEFACSNTGVCATATSVQAVVKEFIEG